MEEKQTDAKAITRHPPEQYPTALPVNGCFAKTKGPVFTADLTGPGAVSALPDSASCPRAAAEAAAAAAGPVPKA